MAHTGQEVLPDFSPQLLSLTQGRLTKVSLKVFLLCILKSLPIVPKWRKKGGNWKESSTCIRLQNPICLFVNTGKCLVSLKQLWHWHFLSFLMKLSFCCTKHGSDPKVQKVQRKYPQFSLYISFQAWGKWGFQTDFWSVSILLFYRNYLKH